MPELPEVETVRRTLKKQILNKKIKDIQIIYPKIIENDIEEFKNILINNKFNDISRRGKYLIFHLNDYFLISHLRMEGKFFIKNIEDPIQKHEHLIISFDDKNIRYHDTRKFGRMIIIPQNKLDDYFKNLGPDANSDYINLSTIKSKINASKLPIKTLLLDQNIIAGLGNIYVDEVLYMAGISPLKEGFKITSQNVKAILYYSKIILDKAIEYKGTTIRSYTSSLGVYGEYQQFLKVHTKDGFKCDNNHDIIKIRVGGRGTYYCPKCQIK